MLYCSKHDPFFQRYPLFIIEVYQNNFNGIIYKGHYNGKNCAGFIFSYLMTKQGKIAIFLTLSLMLKLLKSSNDLNYSSYML